MSYYTPTGTIGTATLGASFNSKLGMTERSELGCFVLVNTDLHIVKEKPAAIAEVLKEAQEQANNQKLDKILRYSHNLRQLD